MGKATIIEAQNSQTVYEDGKKSGILGKLKGIFADYKNGTRNADRLYTEELWDNRVFGSPDVMEAMETKTLFGELDHPEGDRCETLAQNAAISITKLEKKPEEGVIYGEAEILDTPTGRIVKALADSGAKLGISSRGMGEEIYENGQNIIDPETYDFITFDVVVTPANTKARVALTESKHNKLTENLKKEIIEAETENQLNQIRTAVNNSSINTKTEIISLIETKLSKLDKKITLNNKLQEANKQIAFELLTKKLKDTEDSLNESLNANKQLASENLRLIEENNFYKDSKDMLKSKLKESLLNEEIIDNSKQLETKLEQANKQIIKLKNIIKENKTNYEDILNKTKEVKERKIENIQSKYEDNIKSLKVQKEAAEIKFNNLVESNKQLAEKLQSSSKIILENKELKKKIETLENEKLNNVKKLEESKLQENNQIKELKEALNKANQTINVLQAEKIKMEEAEDRFSKLAFNPMGTFKAVAENFSQEEFSQDELQLFNALINN